jgi:hypothetical protein
VRALTLLFLLASACSTTKQKVWTYSSGSATLDCGGQTTTITPSGNGQALFSENDSLFAFDLESELVCSFSESEEDQVEGSCSTGNDSFPVVGSIAPSAPSSITISLVPLQNVDLASSCTAHINITFVEK